MWLFIAGAVSGIGLCVAAAYAYEILANGDLGGTFYGCTPFNPCARGPLDSRPRDNPPVSSG